VRVPAVSAVTVNAPLAADAASSNWKVTGAAAAAKTVAVAAMAAVWRMAVSLSSVRCGPGSL
jgi:hypothetical protein